MLYIFPTLLIKISYKWFIFHFETGFPPAPQSNKGSQSERMANDLIWPQYTQPPQTLCKLTKYSPLQRGDVCQIPQLWHSPFIHCAKRSTIFYVFLFILFHNIAEKANVCFVETVRETKAITLEFRLNEHHFSGNNNITSDTTFRVNWPDLLPWHLAHWLVLTLHYIDVTLQNRAMLFFFPQNQTSKGFYLPVKSFDVSVWQNYIGSVCLIFTPCCTFHTLSSSIFLLSL